MMNSHIAIFLAGTTNGSSPTVIPGGWCECAAIVMSAWLTGPPVKWALQFHPKQQKQVHPKNVDKVPVARGRVHGRFSERGIVQLSDHANHSSQPADQMQRMGCGENVEERTGWIGRK